MNIRDLKKEMWEVVYRHVDPFRKKKDKDLIRWFVVYCDRYHFKEIIDKFITIFLSKLETERNNAYMKGFREGASATNFTKKYKRYIKK